MNGVERGFYSHLPRSAAKKMIVELIKSGFSNWDPHIFCSIPGTIDTEEVILFKTEALIDEIINENK